MEYETHGKDSLPASLRYAVRGTGPTAEAAHGRYLRRVTRYLQSKRPVQWLIVTEAIRRPEAPAANTPAQDSDTDSDDDSDASTSEGQTDHLLDIRRRLFDAGAHHGASQPIVAESKNNTAPAEAAGGGTQHDAEGISVPDASQLGDNGVPVPIQSTNPAVANPGEGTRSGEDAATVRAARGAGSDGTPAPAHQPTGARDEDRGAAETAELTSTQLAASRSSRRTLARDQRGRFVRVKAEPVRDSATRDSTRDDVAAQNVPATTVTAPQLRGQHENASDAALQAA